MNAILFLIIIIAIAMRFHALPPAATGVIGMLAGISLACWVLKDIITGTITLGKDSSKKCSFRSTPFQFAIMGGLYLFTSLVFVINGLFLLCFRTSFFAPHNSYAGGWCGIVSALIGSILLTYLLSYVSSLKSD